ncbi:DUF4159 domain-containing protein [Telmatospirillum sp.]|uniref:DUF4159 domain-containing protein n=1 Tax=Telmatospirillum sp. TaxID=2079197 RepID=UPI00284B27F9|nr:DUF4159 domain-containing protein [Telmatospirillum sp.]MDR3437214.1 DUF4159 domain-containing protein [Telmatospirillum sp.]
MWTVGSLTFVLPWALAGGVLLPLLWWLLRTTPPSPRRQPFPAIRLLMGLVGRDQTAARTPLWLMLLRVFLAVVIIMAAAHPLINAAPGYGKGPVLLVVDDGWAAARLWPQRQATLEQLLNEAERGGRPVRLLPTAPPAEGTPLVLSQLMPAAEAKAVVQAWRPLPWPADRVAARQALDAMPPTPDLRIVWLTDGLSSPGDQALAERLRGLGRLEVIGPPETAIAKLLLPPSAGTRDLTLKLRRAAAGPDEAVVVRAKDGAGNSLGIATATFASGGRDAEVVLPMPEELRNRTARLDIDDEVTAGAVVLLDDRWRRHPVGLIDERAGNGGSPLLDDLFYVDRALAPRADLRRGRVGELLQRDLSLIVLADQGSLSESDTRALKSWIDGGGVLLRVAGPKLAQNPDDLLPVRLRNGGRALGGAMSWTQPMSLAPMPDTSPFVGLAVPRDLKVGTQLLAEPGPDLDERTWARLADGTPLVTGAPFGKGWLVLIHTTVGPAWSNLGLSGLLPDMAERLLSLSRGFAAGSADRPLAPADVLDGFGHLDLPSGEVEPLPAKAALPVVGPHHPPGYYGDDTVRRALNLGSDIAPLTPLKLPTGVSSTILGGHPAERDLQPPLLMLAVALFLADLLAVLALRGLLSRRPSAFWLVALIAFPALVCGGRDALAATDMERQAALQTRLAYVLTGKAQVDDTSRAGLLGLSQLIQRRTTASLGEPTGVDVARDSLMVFPLLYWPVTDGQGPLSAAARDKINDYMRKGGLILFDTQDQGDSGAAKLRSLTMGLDIPPLVAVTEDHVLTHSFYILRAMPGRLDGAPVYVAAGGDPANDNVSPVVIGANDWAGAWAVDRRGDQMFAVVPGGEQQREMAYRFGVNLVMYALTGSYKADQVHLPAIWERLKR